MSAKPEADLKFAKTYQFRLSLKAIMHISIMSKFRIQQDQRSTTIGAGRGF